MLSDVCTVAEIHGFGGNTFQWEFTRVFSLIQQVSFPFAVVIVILCAILCVLT